MLSHSRGLRVGWCASSPRHGTETSARRQPLSHHSRKRAKGSDSQTPVILVGAAPLMRSAVCSHPQRIHLDTHTPSWSRQSREQIQQRFMAAGSQQVGTVTGSQHRHFRPDDGFAGCVC